MRCRRGSAKRPGASSGSGHAAQTSFDETSAGARRRYHSVRAAGVGGVGPRVRGRRRVERREGPSDALLGPGRRASSIEEVLNLLRLMVSNLPTQTVDCGINGGFVARRTVQKNIRERKKTRAGLSRTFNGTGKLPGPSGPHRRHDSDATRARGSGGLANSPKIGRRPGAEV